MFSPTDIFATRFGFIAAKKKKRREANQRIDLRNMDLKKGRRGRCPSDLFLHYCASLFERRWKGGKGERFLWDRTGGRRKKGEEEKERKAVLSFFSHSPRSRHDDIKKGGRDIFP